jgi:hypothetical protein
MVVSVKLTSSLTNFKHSNRSVVLVARFEIAARDKHPSFCRTRHVSPCICITFIFFVQLSLWCSFASLLFMIIKKYWRCLVWLMEIFLSNKTRITLYMYYLHLLRTVVIVMQFSFTFVHDHKKVLKMSSLIDGGEFQRATRVNGYLAFQRSFSCCGTGMNHEYSYELPGPSLILSIEK